MNALEKIAITELKYKLNKALNRISEIKDMGDQATISTYTHRIDFIYTDIKEAGDIVKAIEENSN